MTAAALSVERQQADFNTRRTRNVNIDGEEGASVLHKWDENTVWEVK